MFEKVFGFLFKGDGPPRTEALRTGFAKLGLALIERKPSRKIPAPPENAGFEEIYQRAMGKLPKPPLGIPKLREMIDSPYLEGMTPDSRRCALLMALDASGARIEDLLQDAVTRQRVLCEYEELEEKRLREYEAAKMKHSRTIQEELDKVTCESTARMQANADEIASRQDGFLSWQKRRLQECQRMAEATAMLVPQGGAACGSTLNAVLERASATRR